MDNLIEFAKEQCKIFPEDSAMGEYLRETIKMLQAEPCEDAISKASVFEIVGNLMSIPYDLDRRITEKDVSESMDEIRVLPPVTPTQRWIPVSERLPEDLEPVNITWVNHEPEPYYHDIKDRNFVATGIYYRGQWYWYSTTCADYLGEYGSNEIDKVDDAVEIIAWMPLPEPYKESEEE